MPTGKRAINSRAKGKQGELELAQVLRAAGWNARRGVQYSGGDTSQDLTHDIPGVHIECKRTEVSAIYNWLAQAKADAAEGNIPIVAHRKNKEDWVAILPLKDLLSILDLAHGRF